MAHMRASHIVHSAFDSTLTLLVLVKTGITQFLVQCVWKEMHPLHDNINRMTAFTTYHHHGHQPSSNTSARLTRTQSLWKGNLRTRNAFDSISKGPSSTTLLQSSLSSILPIPVVVVPEVINLEGFSILISSTTETVDDVLSTNDLVIGTILAFALAFLASFLQSQTPSSSNILLWPRRIDMLAEEDTTTKDMEQEYIKEEEEDNQVVFSADNWKEMSRPENYVLYNTRVKDRTTMSPDKSSSFNPSTLLPNSSSTSTGTSDDTFLKDEIPSSFQKTKRENKLVLVALLLLFVPIFSIEFFFALSRQFICGDYLSTNVGTTIGTSVSPWANEFCSPH